MPVEIIGEAGTASASREWIDAGVPARDQTSKEGLRRAPAGDGTGSSMAGTRTG